MLILAGNLGEAEGGSAGDQYAWKATGFGTLAASFPAEVCTPGVNACLPVVHSWLAPGSKGFSPIIVVGLVLVWVIVGVYVLCLFISKTHQTLYDLLAGTYVIKS